MRASALAALQDFSRPTSYHPGQCPVRLASPYDKPRRARKFEAFFRTLCSRNLDVSGAARLVNGMRCGQWCCPPRSREVAQSAAIYLYGRERSLRFWVLVMGVMAIMSAPASAQVLSWQGVGPVELGMT